MGEYLLGQRQSQGVQEDGPVDGVETHDFLAHQVHVRGPVAPEQAVILREIAQGGDVVGQRIQPYIHHVLGVEIHGNAPLEGGAGDAQILQAGLEEVVDHLIGPGLGLNEVRMLLQILHQPGGVFAHAEEIAFLVGHFHGPAAIGAHLHAVFFHQLGRRPEGFAGRAVHALIFAFVNISLIVEFLEDFLHDLLVAGLGGADEIVVVDVHQFPQLLGLGHDFVHVFLGRYAGFRGLGFDLLAVFVGAGEEVGVIAQHLLEPGHGIRRHGGVGVTDVHVAAGIIDGRCDIELLLFRHGATSLK